MLLSLESQDKLDHVVFLFKKNGRYGAVSRSRLLGLHGRKPVYRTIRDLAMSYFDPFIDMTGRLIGYGVGDLHELGNYDWRFSLNNVWKVERYLQEIPHRKISSSDTRYQKWHNRYREFIQLHPGRHMQSFPNRHLWML